MIRPRASLLGRSLHQSRKVFIGVGVFSLFINLAMLNSPLFMLQVYDRVLTSRSYDTLFFLTLLAVGILAFQALVEVARSELLVRTAHKLDADISRETFGLSTDRSGRQQTSAQGLR